MKGQFIKPDHWWQNIRFQLLEPMQFRGFVVPAGYVTDGASVPRWLVIIGLLSAAGGHWYWPLYAFACTMLCAVPLFPRFGRTLEAAVLHDYLLTDTNVGWRWANWRFLQELKYQGIATWRCYLMYAAVTVFQAGKHLFKE